MQNEQFIRALIGLTLFCSAGVQATSMPIDLNDFYADPTVTVVADGSSALMEEDPGFAEVFLVNDPGFGDPNVILPGPGVSVVFEYDFSEAVGEDDEFGAFVIDAATGLSIGPSYEFFIDITGSGLVEIDISSLVGLTLGLQFQLAKLPADSGSLSTVTVSNVALITRAVPLPATFVLLVAGLLGLIRIKQIRLKAV